ncbi:unnamed protein product [Microthlaspi erraticum]|uniref:Aspartic peptidase DDI1-type domain-containing protein n=1 Tax=Microthlaspi erraticum TaxID=1685480 RepID=A0A6D2ILF8_9BRAS|nr:unnamed protein product [Microthlaspi erraticum]
MIWPEENYPERESNRARKRRLFPKIIPKTDNSGKFVVPCIIKGNILEQSLCDTGANVNIMSKRIADKIGLTKIEPSSISINYADSFSQTPMALCLIHPKKEKLKTIKEDPIPKPKQLAKQARSKTKAPTPKPPKGSSKIEDEAKPRRKVESLSGRNMKLLFPKELIDENLEGFKEKVDKNSTTFS